MAALSLLLIPMHAPPPGGPLGFLIGAAAMFVVCWIWVGGYLADFVIWLVAKLTPNSANERLLAYGISIAFVLFGLIIAATTKDSEAAPAAYLGGAVAGVGLYIAVRLPGKIRRNRAKRMGYTQPVSGATPPPPPPPPPPLTRTDLHGEPEESSWPQPETPQPKAPSPERSSVFGDCTESDWAQPIPTTPGSHSTNAEGSSPDR